MKIKHYESGDLLTFCCYQKTKECPDYGMTNETAGEEAAKQNIKAISHGVCSQCAEILYAEMDTLGIPKLEE